MIDHLYNRYGPFWGPTPPEGRAFTKKTPQTRRRPPGFLAVLTGESGCLVAINGKMEKREAGRRFWALLKVSVLLCERNLFWLREAQGPF